MSITTRQEFIDYTYRRLGAPVIQINVDAEQAEDRLDESLEYMHERHFDFNERAQFIVPVSSTNILNKYFDTTNFGLAVGAQGVTSASTGLTGYWPSASDIRTITKVYKPGNQVGDYMFDLRYQMTLFDFFGLYFNQGGLSQGPMASYMESMSYLQLINDVFNYPVSYTYTRTTNRLFLETEYKKLVTGSYMMVEAYVQVNPDYYSKVWEDRIFQRHYSAMLKKQWAQNLMKYAGMPLPGGAQLNAGAMMADAIRELDAIEVMLLKTQELPVDPLIG
jgi:hypothetical protein